MTEDKYCYIGKILKLIENLQCTTSCCLETNNSCSRPYLGTPANLECYNTRPVTFYTCDNQLVGINYSVTINGEILTGTSNIFRVEKVNGCCCTVSILISNPDTTAVNRPYISTKQTAIINLNCICCLKCLADTIVDL